MRVGKASTSSIYFITVEHIKRLYQLEVFSLGI